jgi:hypothetical protein
MKKPPSHNISNRYKDPMQSAFHFAAVEKNMDLNAICDRRHGILFLARDYQRIYGKAKVSAIVSCIGSTIVFGGGMALALPLSSPLLISALLGTVLSGLMVSRHSSGESHATEESKFLEQNASLTSVLALSAQKGIPNDVLAAVYEELLVEHSSGIEINAEKIRSIFGKHVNNMIATYQIGSEAETAFHTGEQIALPESQLQPIAFDDEEEEDDDFDDEEIEAEYQLMVPEFLKKAQEQPAQQAIAAKPTLVNLSREVSPIEDQLQTIAQSPMPLKMGGGGRPAPVEAPVIRPLLDRIINIDGFVPSRLGIGAARSGKSQLFSDAGTLLRSKYPAAQIYYVSAGYLESEDGHYWRFANEVAGYSFRDMSPDERTKAYQHWTEMLLSFDDAPYSMDNPKIFIVDELNSVMTFGEESKVGKNFVKALKDKLVLASSLGAKSGYVLWGIAPIGGMAGLNLTRDQASAFNPIYVGKFGSNWNATAYKNAAANGLAPGIPPTGFSENERIVGIGGEWESLPQTQNLAMKCDDFRASTAVNFATAFMETFTDPDPRPSQMSAIYAYSKRRGLPLSKRDIQMARLPAIDGMSADDIGFLLDEMHEKKHLTRQADNFYFDPNNPC